MSQERSLYNHSRYLRVWDNYEQRVREHFGWREELRCGSQKAVERARVKKFHDYAKQEPQRFLNRLLEGKVS